jgi:hypothetical protein
MNSVDILFHEDALILRAKLSELLILPIFLQTLKTLTKPEEFSQYFMQNALVNRPARKLFAAWLRQDSTLWPRLYKAIHAQTKSPNP